MTAARDIGYAYWISDDIVYSVAMHRGIDVLRVDLEV